MDKILMHEVWARLLSGNSLEGLPLGTVDGFIDLRGLISPDPRILKKYQTDRFNVTQIEPSVFRNVHWHNIDFTGSTLKSVRFFDSEICNCIFDLCKLRNMRMWTTKIEKTSFKGADLRDAALGGIYNEKQNYFLDVDFSKADMRETAYKSATFEHCLFKDTRLDKVNFQGSNFIDCRFEGELYDVLFYRFAYKGEAFPPNEMINVDFSRSKLRYVNFRGLTLDRVILPKDQEHIIIPNFASSLDRIIDNLRKCEDAIGKKLILFLENDRKWAIPSQVQGVINLRDIFELAGEDGVTRFMAALRKSI
jgi:uncharacterized protein YjbI with pentapeptide repeats